VVALKKIIKAKVLEYKMVDQFKREVRLHSSLDHPNIVRFYGFFEYNENIYLILEYISGGTLFDYLGEQGKLQPKEAAIYLKDIIEALDYMHEKSIAHRDIKPENIVLTAEKVAKLCDFGWSAVIDSSRTTYCGTFDYAPPEVL
jgi:aurora kinase